jgi:ketopantoate reductase
MIAGPGHVRHAGAHPIRFGELIIVAASGGTAAKCVLADGRRQVEVPEDIHVAIWNKYMVIAPWAASAP